MLDTLKDHCLSYATIENWLAEFKRGRTEVENEHRIGRPVSMSTSGNVDAVIDKTSFQEHSSNFLNDIITEK